MNLIYHRIRYKDKTNKPKTVVNLTPLKRSAVNRVKLPQTEVDCINK